ncbi:MAG: hypothetical protein WBC49_06070 [Thermoplasmata archaeon]
MELKLKINTPDVAPLIFGDIVVNAEGEPYIVANVAFRRVALISLRDGNRWEEPMELQSRLDTCGLSVNESKELLKDKTTTWRKANVERTFE